jgi:STE24 endopeptidase
MVATPVVILGVLLFGVQLLYSGLDLINLRYGAEKLRSAESWIRSRLEVSTPEKMIEYQRITTITSRIQSWVTVAIVFALVASGLYGTIVTRLAETSIPVVAQGITVLAGAVVGSQLLSAPFDLYETFVIEERYGFNNQTPLLWLRDRCVGTALGLIAAGLIGGAVLVIIDRLPQLWPLVGWAVVMTVSILMMIIYPRVVAPLFNEFEPLNSGSVREAVDDVFDQAGFHCEQVYEMDASKRSSHSNAYFIGFGQAKRVVLFDTLLEQMSTTEMQAVLAHELAHWKKAHIWKQLGASAAQMGILFALLWWISTASWVYAAFDLPSVTYAALGIGLLFAGPGFSLLSPLTNQLSLRHEREADDFAAETLNSATPMTRALETLAGENLQNPFPHPAYAAFHMTHPPIPDRIRRLHAQFETAEDDATDYDSLPSG